MSKTTHFTPLPRRNRCARTMLCGPQNIFSSSNGSWLLWHFNMKPNILNQFPSTLSQAISQQKQVNYFLQPHQFYKSYKFSSSSRTRAVLSFKAVIVVAERITCGSRFFHTSSLSSRNLCHYLQEKRLLVVTARKLESSLVWWRAMWLDETRGSTFLPAELLCS